ncbi:hypothetical protein [Aliiglaciecola litoralis]|uniref:TIGR03016 family PEP-CTERM system-associated outer membrane protein n=1 Tax=Aliiglaciecola litoralis TaxID=582857 RepID=A0ABN1LJL8_9ALTE
MKKTLIALLLPACWGAYAGDMSYSAQVETSYINIKSDTGASDPNSSDTFSIRPSLGLTYTANRARASLIANHRYLDRHVSSTSVTNNSRESNFTDYTFDAELFAIENVLKFNARGAQTYQNTDINNGLINDEVFGSQQLAKTQRGTVGATFTLPNPDYFNFSMAGNLTKVKTDRTTLGNFNLNSDNTNITAVLSEGDEVKRVSWNITAEHRDTNGTGRNDILSKTVDGVFYVGLTDDWRFVVTGREETNELKSDQVDTTRSLDYSSAGIGLSYFQDRGRYIDVTYNVSSRQEAQGNERDSFIGLNFNWRFSSRTSIQGNYGKRFYGRSASFQLSHRLKKLRTQISYAENLTTFSRLIAGDTVTGTFVCAIGAVDISQCLQPATVDYVLQPGEEFNNFDFTIPEISEEALLRKNLTMSTGYQFRRIKANLSITHTDTEYLDSLRSQKTFNVNLALSMRFGRKSTLSWTNGYSQFDREIRDGVDDDSDTWRSGLNYNYNVSREMSVRAGFQVVSRDSPVLTQDFSSRRLTLGMTYKFK